MRLLKIGAMQQRSNMIYDADLQIYLDSLTTPLSGAHKTLLNNFILTIKTGLNIISLSEIFDAMLIKANETAEAALKNLVKRAHDATIVGSPVFTPLEGYKGNGTSDVIFTNYNPFQDKVNFAQNDNHSLVYFRTLNTNSAMVGCRDASGYVHSTGQGDSVLGRRYYNNATTYIVEPRTDLGMFGNVRDATDSQRLYVNDNQIQQNQFRPSEGIPDANYTLLAFDDIGTPNRLYMNNQQSFWSIGKYLTIEQHRVVTNAFEAYMDANGKGVIP